MRSPSMRLRIAIAAALVVSATGAEAGVLVTFRAKATASGGVVTLGDVADLRGTDPAEAQRLATIILGPAPAAGRETAIEFEAVRSRLMAAGVDLAAVEFAGTASVRVAGPSESPEPVVATTREVPPNVRERAERAVAAAVQRHLSVRSAGVLLAVEAHVAETDVAVIAAAASRGFEVAGGAAPWTGEQTFALRFFDEVDQVREARVTCRIASRPSVLAAKHPLPRGHVLRADDLVWKKAETDDEAACLSDPRRLLGMETQRPLRTGEPIPPDAVKTLPLVRAGQFVMVTSRRPGLAVQRVMKAKADGAAGEVVALITLEDRQTVLARVTGLQEAEVVDQDAGIASAGLGDLRDIAPAGAILPAGFEQPPMPQSAARTDAPRMLVNPTQPLSVPKG